MRSIVFGSPVSNFSAGVTCLFVISARWLILRKAMAMEIDLNCKKKFDNIRMTGTQLMLLSVNWLIEFRRWNFMYALKYFMMYVSSLQHMPWDVLSRLKWSRRKELAVTPLCYLFNNLRLFWVDLPKYNQMIQQVRNLNAFITRWIQYIIAWSFPSCRIAVTI